MEHVYRQSFASVINATLDARESQSAPSAADRLERIAELKAEHGLIIVDNIPLYRKRRNTMQQTIDRANQLARLAEQAARIATFANKKQGIA